jgi:hypothetical protein
MVVTAAGGSDGLNTLDVCSACPGRRWRLLRDANCGGIHVVPDICGGTIFKISSSGAPTTIYSFCALTGRAEGAIPAGLLLASDGDFYGTTFA